MAIKKKKEEPVDNSEFQDEPIEQEPDLPVVKKKTEQQATQKSYDKIFIQQWKNRRWMAWVSLISILIFTGAGLFYVPTETLEAASNLLSWYYMTASTIVVTYMGLSTYASLQQNKKD